MDRLPDNIDLLSDHEKVDSFDVARSNRPNSRGLLAIAVIAAVSIWVLSGRGGSSVSEEPGAIDPAITESDDGTTVNETTDETTDDSAIGFESPLLSDRLDAAVSTQGIPEQLLAAELFNAAPNAETLRNLLVMLGGFDGLLTVSAEGAFDFIRFDPTNPNRLLASARSSYGEADNSQTNEVWVVGQTNVNQQLWMPDRPHDYAHFNIDGSVTLWANEGTADFSPRVATVWINARQPLFSTDPLFASRFTATGDGVFALTGDGDYYSNDNTYVDLVADQGDGPVVLDDGSMYGWIDNPSADILVAYPVDETGTTAVWDTATLEPLATHPLAGRAYIRSAVSGDQSVAIGVRTDGVMEVLDMNSGQVTADFAEVDIDRVDLPVTINHDGTVAWTVENNGQLSVWWVGDPKPIGGVTTYAGQPRWVSEPYSPLTTSVMAPGGRHAVLRIGPTLTTDGQWLFTDTDIQSWIQQACDRSGRPLTTDEVERLGLDQRDLACQG